MITSAGCGVPATFTGTALEPELSNVTVSPLLKIVVTPLVCQLSAPLMSQTFRRAIASLHRSARGVITMLTSGVALASGEFGLKPLLLVEATV